MVFGIIRNNKDDSNFQSLQESENFSYFDDSTIIDHRASSTTENQGQTSLLGYGAPNFDRNSLLMGLRADDGSDDELDTKLLNDLVTRHVNAAQPTSRSASLTDILKEENGTNDKKKSSPRRSKVLRAPSLEVDRDFDGTLDNTDNNSYDSDAIESAAYSNDTADAPMQLQIPGIIPMNVTTTGRTQNTLESVMTKHSTPNEKVSTNSNIYEGRTTVDHNASIAFTTCFDHEIEEDIEPYAGSVSLMVGKISVDIKELESLEIIDKDTVRKIYEYVLYNRETNQPNGGATSKHNNISTSSNMNQIEDSRDLAKTLNGKFSNQIRSPNRSSSEWISRKEPKDKGLPSVKQDPLHEEVVPMPKPRVIRRSSTSGVTDMQVTESELGLITGSAPRERRKSLHSSPERKSMSKGVDLISTAPTSRPRARRNSTTGSREDEENNTEKKSNPNRNDETEPIGDDKSQSRPRVGKVNHQSPGRRAVNKGILDGTKSDNVEVKGGELNRHSYSSPKKGKIRRHTSNDKQLHDDCGKVESLKEGSSSDIQQPLPQIEHNSRESSNCNSYADIQTSNATYSPTRVCDEKKHNTILGNTGKMMKMLSQRMLNQDKDRPSLIKSESQPVLTSPRLTSRGRTNDTNLNAESSQHSVGNAATKDVTLFDSELITPRSQKRFLNWRANGTKKQPNQNLIEGELEVTVHEEVGIGAGTSTEFTVSNDGKKSVEGKKSKAMGSEVAAHDYQNALLPGILRKSTHKISKDVCDDVESIEFSCDIESSVQPNAKDLSSHSRPNETRSKTNSATRQRTEAPRDIELYGTTGHPREQNKDSQLSQGRSKNTNSNRVQSRLDQGDDLSTDLSSENITMLTSEAPKSPAARRRSSVHRGLSQSVHVSPNKRGKGSSSAVSRRLQAIASTPQDTTNDFSSQTNTVSSNVPASQDLSKALNETIDDAGGFREHKYLSQSVHISPVKRKVGKNTEIPLNLESDLQTKSKMTVNSVATVEGATIDVACIKPDCNPKHALSTRIRKTTVDEFKKDFVNKCIDETSGELVSDENGGRKQRPLMKKAINKMLNLT